MNQISHPPVDHKHDVPRETTARGSISVSTLFDFASTSLLAIDF